MLRSLMPEVRNPVLKLPAARELQELPAETKAVLRRALVEMSRIAQVQAQACWKRHKAPMAIYWKVVAVYSRHFAQTLK